MFDQSKSISGDISELIELITHLSTSECTAQNDPGMKQSLDAALNLINHLEVEHTRQNDRINYLERMAMTDGLTNILNRRGFQAELQRVLASARRFDESGVLAYIDLDDFKQINDTFGHACGDAVLCHVAKRLESMTRGMDYIARLGGDEFGALLVRTDFDTGCQRIEKISQSLNGCHIEWNGQDIQIHASIGMQRYSKTSRAFELMNAADEAMYSIKKMKITNSTSDPECTLNAAQ